MVRTSFVVAALACLTALGAAQGLQPGMPQRGLPNQNLPNQILPNQENAAAEVKSYRVQVMLIEVAEKAEHAKLVELRGAAQSGKSVPGVIAMADQLIEAGVAGICFNAVNRCAAGAPVKSESEADLITGPGIRPTSEQAPSQALSDDYSLYMSVASSAGLSSVAARFEIIYQRSGASAGSTFTWEGSWTGRECSEAILCAETPRKAGATAGREPVERYLLMRIDPVE